MTTDIQSDLSNPAFVAELRSQMLKYAIQRLPDEHLAEDAVQEALAGALKNAGSFGRRSALKTWVFSILKNKIFDIHRQRKYVPERSPDREESEVEDIQDTLFDARGSWQTDEQPANWSSPMAAVQNEDFWRVFETCLQGLPGNQSHLFMKREFLECKGDEICKSEGISLSNLHTQLYRARLRLRECLENRWFLKGERR